MVRASSPGRAESLEELAQRRLEEVQAAVGKAEPDRFYVYDTFDPTTIRRRPINKAPPAASTPSPPDAQDDPVAAHKRQKIDNEAFESRSKDEFLKVGESDGLGRGREQFKSDEEFIKSSILYLVGVWKHKSEETKWKGTIVGKTKTYLDTVDRMRPLVALLEHVEKAAPEDQHRVPPAVVDVLKGVFEEIIKREYVEANKLYLDMTVGNQLWPMGGINLGGLPFMMILRQVCRRVEEKSHLLDDVEVKRYVQGIKRLITNLRSRVLRHSLGFPTSFWDVSAAMQQMTVVPRVSEAVLKPSQLAFKITQAAAAGKQELLREDLASGIIEQMSENSGRWSPSRLCPVLFQVSQVAPGSTLLRDMVMAARHDLEKALDTAGRRTSGAAAKELSEVAMVMRRIPSSPENEEVERRLWSLVGSHIPGVGSEMELLDLAYVGIALQDCPDKLRTDSVNLASKWIAEELSTRFLASSQSDHPLNTKGAILAIGVIGRSLQQIEDPSQILGALPFLVVDIATRVPTLQSLLALSRSLGEFPQRTAPQTVAALTPIVSILQRMANPQMMSSPGVVSDALEVITLLVRHHKRTMKAEHRDAVRSLLERMGREVLLPVHAQHPFNLHQVLLVCRGYRAMDLRLPALSKFIRLAVKVEHTSNRLALAEVMEHCVALGFHQPTTFFVPIVDAVSKERKYSRTGKKLREMLRKIEKESTKSRSSFHEIS
ncbi:hypothetical protein FOZ61_008495 [Perkinsus olseni]|uniref:Pre-mRNA-splicing factor 18 n=2 Tax=Perkinsus olseni TaxID=32597 RepID=A0A7J6L450_PEROL|nr:hypothetical protein FOZ61_008495 [Perkinsus olseni]